jgi:hypothetical protein
MKTLKKTGNFEKKQKKIKTKPEKFKKRKKFTEEKFTRTSKI